MPCLPPLPQAFTNSGFWGTDPLQSSKGRAGQQVQKKSLLAEAASVEGAPLSTFQPLKVTKLVWENREAPSPGSLGSPCPAGAAECDLAQPVGVQVLGAVLHPFTLFRGWGLGAGSRGLGSHLLAPRVARSQRECRRQKSWAGELIEGDRTRA